MSIVIILDQMLKDKLGTKIFLDSGNPDETRKAIQMLGYLDGQTTNPSLVAQNPKLAEKFEAGQKLSEKELLGEYFKIVTEISELIPEGSVSIEVYSDYDTTATEMLNQAREMFTWISNAHIKFPTTTEGLKAAERAIHEGMRVNMTLVFSQEQAAAVYAATKGAGKGDVFVSPFIGRLDDINVNGMDLVSNIQDMYEDSDGHVEVLAASLRSVEHLQYIIKSNFDIATIPFKVIKAWYEVGLELLNDDVNLSKFLETGEKSNIEYLDLDLTKPWNDFNIQHELTDKGIAGFVADWSKLLEKE